jgi:hypothetical protein
MNTFEMTTDLRNSLATRERARKDSVNKWEHRAGQACFAVMAIVLILRAAGVL